MTANSDLETRRRAAVARGAAGKGVYAVRAENAELWDADGRRYLDLAAGIAVLNTGHRHPRVMAAVEEQMAAFTHTCFHVAPFEGYVRLCERLNAAVDTGAPNRSLLLTTGVEAVENAIKIARAATGRSGIVAFGGGFHGRTSLGMALTGKVMPYKRSFGPSPVGIFHAPFPNAYHGVSVDEALRGLDMVLHADLAPEDTAAFIVEPVQGEGGFNVIPPEFMAALREIADRHGILLIVDEVQGGMARTGRMLSVEHTGVKPDLVTLAKGLGGGFPISAVVGRAEVMDVPHAGGLGGTYAGNPLAVAAANAVLDVIEDENLIGRATEIGARIKSRLTATAQRNAMSAIGDIRGLGAMIAFELVTDRDSRAPDPGLAARIAAEAERAGLLILTCGTRGNAVRLLPPLTISDTQLDEALDLLDQAIAAAIGADIAA
ncbi:4-aminobutyrate--2-oxoglutarate transaminase [Mesobaculum littorinae]|uniref:4-aminobutyrate--2-oxoglutarate transaminase n=1 Tax=Mesobaculum littorinae TaxID=2486419 RepID=A0A438AKT6_9RHOB|nr:4-aminobutyrate--2-oxoglutarate transaminase [Mesobaculum littorinae]RVV99225.1 4-aminobutyrate--2-oxoglutarate transaminase [Mesobaculum littorinae]